MEGVITSKTDVSPRQIGFVPHSAKPGGGHRVLNLLRSSALARLLIPNDRCPRFIHPVLPTRSGCLEVIEDITV